MVENLHVLIVQSCRLTYPTHFLSFFPKVFLRDTLGVAAWVGECQRFSLLSACQLRFSAPVWAGNAQLVTARC